MSMANSIRKFASYASITLFFFGLATSSVQAQVNDPYTFTYTTTLVPLIDRAENQRRRVPEPSALLGLVTVFGLFATQRKFIKREQNNSNFKFDKEEN
uniref:Exosortase n=5 Tax=Nostocales TaxID=1161 RepID=A0A0C1MYS5_9CYAN